MPRRPPPDVFSGHVRSVFLSESVLDPVYRGAVILLPWGELIQNVPGTIVVSMIYAFAITSLGLLIAAF